MDSIFRGMICFGKLERKVAKQRESWKHRHGGEATEVTQTSLMKANCYNTVLQTSDKSKKYKNNWQILREIIQ